MASSQTGGPASRGRAAWARPPGPRHLRSWCNFPAAPPVCGPRPRAWGSGPICAPRSLRPCPFAGSARRGRGRSGIPGPDGAGRDPRGARTSTQAAGSCEPRCALCGGREESGGSEGPREASPPSPPVFGFPCGSRQVRGSGDWRRRAGFGLARSRPWREVEGWGPRCSGPLTPAQRRPSARPSRLSCRATGP